MGMSRQLLTREAPNINGFIVPPSELSLPATMLDPNKRESWNNHHGYFYARDMGRLVMTQTLRDLDTSQFQLPKDVHNVYHDRYSPAPLPAMVDIMDHLDEAYERQIPLRYGSANLPTYNLITRELYRLITREYNQFHE
jgi:hypothetical protein